MLNKTIGVVAGIIASSERAFAHPHNGVSEIIGTVPITPLLLGIGIGIIIGWSLCLLKRRPHEREKTENLGSE